MKAIDSIPKLIKYNASSYTIHLSTFDTWLNDELDHGLDVEPDFQRLHVWSRAQQISFIEYMLKGGIQQPLYFNCPEHPTANMDYVLVDGRNRLISVKLFLDNQLPAFGATLNEYDKPDVLKRSNGIVVSINTLKTKAEVLQWYIEINATGTPHTEQELTKAKDLLDKELSEVYCKNFTY